MQLMANPWLDDSKKAVVQQLYAQEMQRMDPKYQMEMQAGQLGLEKSQLELEQMRNPVVDPLKAVQLEKQRLELDQMRNPRPKFENVGGRLVQINGDGTFKEAYAPPDRPPAKPAEIQEYEYAVGQGFKGSLQDWKASQKGGMSLQVDPATGQVNFTQGGGNIKPMTEGQSKDTVYSVRAKGALETFEPVAKHLNSYSSAAGGAVPFFGNSLKGTDYQLAEQAGNEFLQAILRKDTGAAITQDEQVLYGRTFLPQPGDSADVMAQKAASRQRAVLAIEAGMPPAAIVAQELALRKAAKETPNSAVEGGASPKPDKRVEDMTDQELEALVNGQ
jgi:hypothetical protein